MSAVSILLLSMPSVAFRRAALPVLQREFSEQQAARIWQDTQRRQRQLRKTRPRHSLGVNRVLRTFEWDCALFLAARQDGVPVDTIGPLVNEITWDVFGSVIALSFKASRLRSRQLRRRVKWVLDLMFGVLFTSPFQRTAVPSTEDIAFNVTVCPLARYFDDHGAPELTPYAACGLDYHMADLWGVSLHRTQTLAEGGSLCDFRFKIHGRSAGDGASSSPGKLPIVR